ncbi:MAG: PhzF family phenazine biosynthesis protein [Ferruginibacter sp.]
MTLYQIDAFSNKLFSGNPAAVIPLQQWIPDHLMQQIALENNLSETVFFVPSDNDESDFDIRWFTPEVEINLCGHATLAAAFTLYTFLGFKKPALKFCSKSGILAISKQENKFRMDFPSWKPERLAEYPAELPAIIGGQEIVAVYQHRDILVELNDETAVKNCNPDFTLMKKHFSKMIITAPGSPGTDGQHVDFVSRFFAPGAGINEDPVTGSAHSQLIPFWNEKLGRKKMFAKQLSKRGGEIWCEQLSTERVAMAGECIFYMKGEIELPSTSISNS